MRTRVVSTIILWVVVIAILALFRVAGGVWVVAALAFLTQAELYGLLEKAGYRSQRWTGLICGVLLVLGSYYGHALSSLHSFDSGSDLLVLGIVAAVIAVAVREEPEHQLNALVGTVFGILYVPFTLQFFIKIVLLYEFEASGLVLAFWLAAVAKFSDVGALLVGSRLGRHRLAPSISPNKTWEGAVGGVVVAVAVALALHYLLDDLFPETLFWWESAIVAGIVAIIAIISDLVESLIKRRAGVKDSGSLIPGIGGLFDLTDSLILSIPVGYFLLKYLG